KTILYCPFDATKAYCVDEITCASLGFTDTISECPGEYTLCPSDATKGKCIFEASPGDLKYSLRTAAHNGWLPCDGSTYSSTQFPELYAAISSSFGTKLPYYYAHFIKAVNGYSGSSLSKEEEAGLPNITGYFSAGLGAQNGSYKDGSGAISKSSTYNMAMKGGNSDDWGRNFYFNASKSNSIYGKSSTVTPQNYSANVFIYAGRKKGSATNLSCSQGDFYLSDGTCSSSASGKTVLGMVYSFSSTSTQNSMTLIFGGGSTAASADAADQACKNNGGYLPYSSLSSYITLVNNNNSKIPTSSTSLYKTNTSRKYYNGTNGYYTCTSSSCSLSTSSTALSNIYYYCVKSMTFVK
ncbi:MAG: tail fiber protein, partial [Alphaproteobacteria bacterium]|nr:tail fiber protein [Alphaproteobacteria bacterium]